MPLEDLINFVAGLTAAQRDAIRTIALVIGSAFVPVTGLVLTWALRGVKRLVNEVIDNTTVKPMIEGQVRDLSVAELVNRIHHDTANLGTEVRSELSDLVNDPRTGPQPRLHGRRRDVSVNTDQVTRSPRYRPAVSLYTGIDEEPTNE